MHPPKLGRQSQPEAEGKRRTLSLVLEGANETGTGSLWLLEVLDVGALNCFTCLAIVIRKTCEIRAVIAADSQEKCEQISDSPLLWEYRYFLPGKAVRDDQGCLADVRCPQLVKANVRMQKSSN